MHPRYEVPKTYVATVVGDLTPEGMRRLRRGIWLAEGRTRPAQVRVISHGRAKSLLEITLREGRNRQVRRMLARLEHNVRELVRTRIGRITLRGMKVGEARRLDAEEIEYLKALPDMQPEAPPAFEKARAGRLRGPRRFEEGGAGRAESSASAAGQGDGVAGPPVEAGRPSAKRPDRGPRRYGKREPGAGPSRDRGPRRYDKTGPRRFDKRGPPRFDKAGPRRFDNRGPAPQQRYGDDGPPIDVEHPFAGRSDRGPPRFDKAGPRRFEKAGPRRFEKRGPGDERGRNRGPKRFEKAGPRRRNDFGKFKGESKGERPYQPRDSYREKRSSRQHDTDGTRKAGEGFRGHEGRGGRGGRGRPDRPPFGGRRPDRRPPK
jgi:hypothetical protein